MKRPRRNLYLRIATPNFATNANSAANGAQSLRPTSRQSVPFGWTGS